MRKAFAKDLSMQYILKRIENSMAVDDDRYVVLPLAKSEVLELSYMGFLIGLGKEPPKLGGLTKEDLEIFRGDYDAKLCRIQW